MIDSSILNEINNNNLNVFKKVPLAKWEALINILEFLTKDSDEPLIIDKSIIMHTLKNGGIIKANLLEIFDNDEIDLHISSPKKWTKLFKTLKSDFINIFNETNRFIITDGQVKLFLPKQISSYVNSVFFPNLEDNEKLSEIVIQKETRDKILNLSKSSTFIELLIHQDKFKSVNIPNTAQLIMPDFLNDDSVDNISIDNADLVLRSAAFLPFPADTYQYIIGKKSDIDSYFSYSFCNSHLIKIEIYELLENSSGINSFF